MCGLSIGGPIWFMMNILHNAVDLGLVAFPNRTRQLEVIPFCEDDLVLICHPKHRLAQFARVSISDLKDDKLIGFESDIPTRRATDQILRDQNLNPEPIMEFDNIETVKRAVEINAGIAICAQGHRAAGNQAGHCCPGWIEWWHLHATPGHHSSQGQGVDPGHEKIY